nr:putative transporter [uncultured Campylobacter sp.]
MFSSFFVNKKWAAWAYFGLAALLISTYAQVQMIVLLNNWYKDFYDILQNVKDHTIEDFWTCVLRFAKIAFPYVLLATMTNYFTRLWTFKWREAMTFDYIKYWRNVKIDIEGSSQRIQEDIYRFAKVVENLGSQVADAVMTLIAFIPILWALSGQVDIPLLGKSEGSLVWIALTVSIGGLAISWFVGIKLPGLEYNNQKVEAAFRKELVYAEDDKANYGAPEKLEGLFNDLKRNYYRLFLHYGYFDIWRYMFGQSMVIVPLIAMGPSVLAGTITLGVMMQVVNAFSQVRGSLAVFMNNWTVITELRSIHKRLKEFEKNIEYKRVSLDENLQSEPA